MKKKTKKQEIKLFIRFLKEYKIYNKYIKAYSNNKQYEFVNNNIKTHILFFLKHNSMNTMLHSAFRFTDTLEHYTFWISVSYEWAKYYNEYNKEI